MSVSAFIPLVEPLVRLIMAVLEGASRSDDPRRYLERRLEAELAHRAAQEAARRVLDGGER